MSAAPAFLKSPLDAQVDAILANPQYVGGDLARRLVDTLQRHYPALGDGRSKAVHIDPREMIRRAINSLQETIEKMNVHTFGEDGIDSAGLKRVVDSNEKLIRLLSRLQGELKANDRQQALEEAVVEALEGAETTALRESYLKRFHQKLAEKSQKLREIE